MAEEFLFQGRADLGQISREANETIDQIEKKVRDAVARSRSTSASDKSELHRFGAELAKAAQLANQLEAELGDISLAARRAFTDTQALIREQVGERFPQRRRRNQQGELVPTGRPAYDRSMASFRGEDLGLVEEASAERRRYLDALRVQRRAMEMSIQEERNRLRRQGQISASEASIAHLVTEEARVKAEINAMEKVRAAQVRRATQLNLRSSDPGFNEFVRISGQGEALERETNARTALAAEREMARSRTEMAQVAGERSALEARRLAAERLASAQARPDLRPGTLRDEADANLIRERENIRRRQMEEEGRADDVGRRFALQREAQAKLINDLRDSAATQGAISESLRENQELVAREVVERHRAQATRRAFESEALAGPGGDEIRSLNAREKIAKQQQVALQEAETRRQMEALPLEERSRHFAASLANLQAREVATRQRKLIEVLSSTQNEIRVGDIGDNVVALESQIALAKARQKEAIDRETQRLFAQANMPLPGSTGAMPYGPPPPQNLTGFQRLYSNMQGRRMAGYGGVGAPPTIGQFLGSRAMSTVGYAVGGSLAFGAMAGVGSMIKEAQELELQLNILEAQFAAVGASHNFQQVRESLLEVSLETAVAADEMAQLTVQFAGVFRTDGAPDPQMIREASTIAGELAKIGDINVGDIYDDLIAGARAFSENDTAQELRDITDEISNLVVQARNVTGVDIKESLDFIGRSGAIANTAGLTMQQVTAVGATLLQGSGIGGAALAEQFNRILTDFGSFSAELAVLIADYPKLKEAMGDEGVRAAAAGDAEALIHLAGAYQELDAQTRRTIIQDVGGRREGQTLAALFENAATLQTVLENATGEGATRAEEFEKRMETLRESVQQLIVRFQRLGLALYESGLGDFFKEGAQALQVLMEGVVNLLGVFVDLNDATGGVLGNLIMMGVAVRGLSGLGIKGLGVQKTADGVPVVGGVRGGMAGYRQARFAGAGRIGTGLAAGRGALAGGALGTVVPAAAAFLTVRALGDYGDLRDSLSQQGRALRETVQSRFAEVTSREALDALRAQIENVPDSSLMTRAGTFVGRSALPEDIAESEYRRQVYQAYGKAQAEALLEAADVELRALADSAGYDPSGNQLSGADIRSWIEKYIDSEGDSEEHFNVIDLMSRAAEGDGRVSVLDVSQRINAIRERFFAEAKAAGEMAKAIERVSDPNEALETDQMLQGYQVGAVTYEDLKARLDEEVALYEGLIEDGRRARAPMEAILEFYKSLAEAQEKAMAAVKQNLDRDQGIERLLAEITGDTGAQLDADQALQRFQVLSDAGASVEDLTGEVATVIGAYKQMALDKISDAETEAEKLALLDEGFTIPEEARTAIARIITSSDQSRALFQSVAAQIGKHADDVRMAVETAIISHDDAALNAIQALQEAQIAWLKQLRASRASVAIATVRQADLAQSQAGLLDDRIAEAEQQLSEIANLAGAIPTRGSFSESERRSAIGSSSQAKKKREEEAEKVNWAAIEKARRDYQLALAGDDPIRAAQVAMADADSDYRWARQEGDQAGMYQALAARARARHALHEAQVEARSAQRDLQAAQANDDPVAVARLALEDAREAVNIARHATERARAVAEQIRAQRTLQQAIFDLFTSQVEIVIATAESTGNAVRVAQEQLRLVNEQIGRADQLGLSEADRNNLEAERIRGEAALRDATLADRRSLIDYQLAIGEITQGQAISALQSLLTIPNLTEDQMRELNLTIKRMRDQLGQDFQFNLPTQLALPTAYEVRRLGQQGGSVAGGNLSSYQDNRQIQVAVQVTEPGATAEQIGEAVAAAVGDPSRNGVAPRRY